MTVVFLLFYFLEIRRRQKLKAQMNQLKIKLGEVERKLSAYKRQLKRDRDIHQSKQEQVFEEKETEKSYLQERILGKI